MQRPTIERILRTAAGPRPTSPNGTDFDNCGEAQEACYQAWEYVDYDNERAFRLADKAAHRSIYCSDAFNIFALVLPVTTGEMLTLHRWGTRIGEVYFGSEYFKRERGNFYGLTETRPYMRARFGVAQNLMELGCHEEAIQHLNELVELDDGDHLGARLLLFIALPMAGYLLDFHRLNEQYADCSGCYGRYGEVYYQHAIGSDDKMFLAAVKRAMKQNRFVPALLKDPSMPIERIPFGVLWDGPDGAAEYLHGCGTLWTSNLKLKRRLIKAADKLLPEILREAEIEKQQIRNMMKPPTSGDAPTPG